MKLVLAKSLTCKIYKEWLQHNNKDKSGFLMQTPAARETEAEGLHSQGSLEL